MSQQRILREALPALATGMLFGAGLVLSGMTNPQKVLGFLDIFDQWDSSLLFVMIGALAITVPGYQWVLRKKQRPLIAEQFNWPTNKQIDKQLIIGAALFGVGWGLYGICPGPAWVGLIYGQWQIGLFIASMLIGMWACKRFVK